MALKVRLPFPWPWELRSPARLADGGKSTAHCSHTPCAPPSAPGLARCSAHGHGAAAVGRLVECCGWRSGASVVWGPATGTCDAETAVATSPFALALLFLLGLQLFPVMGRAAVHPM